MDSVPIGTRADEEALENAKTGKDHGSRGIAHLWQY
jgi:hypothetical protein